MPDVLSPASLAQLRTMVADVAFDQKLPLYHRATAPDGSGHSLETYGATPDMLLPCMVSAALKLFTSEQLALYADILASKQLLVLQYAPGADVREGDRVVYQGHNWRVVPIAPDSFNVTDKALIVTVT